MDPSMEEIVLPVYTRRVPTAYPPRTQQRWDPHEGLDVNWRGLARVIGPDMRFSSCTPVHRMEDGRFKRVPTLGMQQLPGRGRPQSVCPENLGRTKSSNTTGDSSGLSSR